MNPIDHINLARMRWLVRHEYRQALEQEVLPAFEAFPELPGYTVYKATYGRRTIYRLDPKSGELPALFIKTYTSPSTLKQLKYVWRNSRTRQEWKMGLYLEEHGLPAARCLAMGEIRRAGLLKGDALIQEYLPGHIPFQRYFKKLGNTASKQRAVQELARQVRKLHHAGVLQRDFKPENILVLEKDESLDLRFIDLERAQLWRPPLSLAQRVTNLAKLVQTFEDIGSRQDRDRFFEIYFQDDHFSKSKLLNIRQSIAQQGEIIARKRAGEVRVWPVHTNQLYTQYSHAAWKIYSLRALSRKDLQDRLSQGRLAESIELGLAPDDRPIKLVARACKPYFDLTTMSLAGGALYALRNVHSLENRGFRWVPIMAAIEQRKAGGLREGYILERQDRDRFQRLEQAWTELSDDKRQEFAKALGGYIKKLHVRGVRSRMPLIEIILRDRSLPLKNCFTLTGLEQIVCETRHKSRPDEQGLDEIASALQMNSSQREWLLGSSEDKLKGPRPG